MSLTATAQMSTHVKTHSLYFPVDRLKHMVELASLNMVVDRLVHACWNRLFMA